MTGQLLNDGKCMLMLDVECQKETLTTVLCVGVDDC